MAAKCVHFVHRLETGRSEFEKNQELIISICGYPLENCQVVFLQLLVLVLQDLESLVAVGDVGGSCSELIRPQNLLQLRKLAFLFLERNSYKVSL